VVVRCLGQDPARRPTADEVAALVLGSHEPTVARTRVLPAATEPEEPAALPASASTPPRQRMSRRFVGMLAAGIAVAIVALVALTANRAPGPTPQPQSRLEKQSPRVQAHELAVSLRAHPHASAPSAF